jgi:hypothetical protein
MYDETSGREDLDKLLTAGSFLPLRPVIDELAGAGSASATTPATTGSVRRSTRVRKAGSVDAPAPSMPSDIALLTKVWQKVAEEMGKIELHNGISRGTHASVLDAAVEKYLKPIVHTHTRKDVYTHVHNHDTNMFPQTHTYTHT